MLRSVEWRERRIFVQIRLWCIERSENGNLKEEKSSNCLVEHARQSTISWPAISEWQGTHKNYTSLLLRWRHWTRDLKIRIRADKEAENELDKIARRQDSHLKWLRYCWHLRQNLKTKEHWLLHSIRQKMTKKEKLADPIEIDPSMNTISNDCGELLIWGY